MTSSKARKEAMLFNYGTSYKTDYRDVEFRPRIKTNFKEKVTCQMRRPPPLKDVHTFTDWKERVPFGALHRPKDIIGINPQEVQKPYTSKQDNTERERAQRTRPRVVMTPAISIDDMSDERLRDILVKDMYTSDMTRATREVSGQYFTVKAPLPQRPTPANPVVLPKLQPPYVSPEWRMESIYWDRNQLRTYCDPDSKFWLSRPLPSCEACKQTTAAEAQRKMPRGMKHNY